MKRAQRIAVALTITASASLALGRKRTVPADNLPGQVSAPHLNPSAEPQPTAAPASTAASPQPSARLAAAAPAAPGPAQSASQATCVEQIPEGKERPLVEETFPEQGSSGHLQYLDVRVHHGRGERVQPLKVKLQTESKAHQNVKKAGFIFPDDDKFYPEPIREDEGEGVLTTLRIPVVPLGKKVTSEEFSLPSLPVALARANGNLMTLCTAEHSLTVVDPTASEPNAQPKGNSPSRRQLEPWVAAKWATLVGIGTLVLGLALAKLILWWRRRPRPSVPPPPPRPPWEVALEGLHEVEGASYVQDKRFAEYFDKVSDIVRRYLGDRYGFDGLETTSREMLAHLRARRPFIEVLPEIEVFLGQADLVKFARLTPEQRECVQALEQGKALVARTQPLHAVSTGDEREPEAKQ